MLRPSVSEGDDPIHDPYKAICGQWKQGDHHRIAESTQRKRDQHADKEYPDHTPEEQGFITLIKSQNPQTHQSEEGQIRE